MKNKYSEENLEKVERYLKEQLSPDEQQAFEKEMSEEEDLAQIVEEHRLLMEGVKVAAYREDRQRMQAIHQAMLEDDEEEIPEVRPTHRFSRVLLRRLSSIAAVLLIGITLGIFGMRLLNPTNGNRIADNTDRLENPAVNGYGGIPNGLPLFDATVPLIKVGTDGQGNPEIAQRAVIDIMIFQSDHPQAQHHLENGVLYLSLAEAKDIADWDNATVEVMLQDWTTSDWQFGLLRINENSYQIPFDHEIFIQLFN